ncbi:hypothetical protein NLO413_0723 [Candidatus Neoehrlichia lotoris str. RAC413]|uniref:Uncharacterized protein n=1 Tax=Candidatus Neoehrlichia procyonis str. RAC413 TaxID=1359163 RepID=A0A0F3NMQ6_9RICK|nr:hypothetical protein NLO413_0723 [Candidatus Neoehrlichia lotoris str. RAC413]
MPSVILHRYSNTCVPNVAHFILRDNGINMKNGRTIVEYNITQIVEKI